MKPRPTRDPLLRLERIDQFVREGLLSAIGDDPCPQFVVTCEDRVVGGFGLRVNASHPMLGCCAGVEIALDPSIQGCGVGKAAYRLLLERMIDLKVRVFKGMTANPAVLRLARRMRRPLRGWKLVFARDLPPREDLDYTIL